MSRTTTKLLRPKPAFHSRKLLAWSLIGPFNLLPWMIMIASDSRLSLFGFVAVISIWPCCVGGAIALARLKKSERTRTELLEFSVSWALLTIPIYLFVLGLWLMIVFPLATGQISIFELGEPLARVLIFGFLYLPFAFLIGAIPAFTAALCAYFVTRFVLFDANRPAAKPLPSPVANSE